MSEYVLRIRANGLTFEDTFRATAVGFAMQMAEARYGQGCVLSCLRETWLGD